MPGPAVGSGVDPRVRPHGSWLLFRTPEIIINYLGWTSPVCGVLAQLEIQKPEREGMVFERRMGRMQSGQ